jgi:hypothetical protein
MTLFEWGFIPLDANSINDIETLSLVSKSPVIPAG